MGQSVGIERFALIFHWFDLKFVWFFLKSCVQALHHCIIICLLQQLNWYQKCCFLHVLPFLFLSGLDWVESDFFFFSFFYFGDSHMVGCNLLRLRLRLSKMWNSFLLRLRLKFSLIFFPYLSAQLVPNWWCNLDRKESAFTKYFSHTLASIGTSIVANTGGCEFECAESYYILIYEKEKIMNNSIHFLKKTRYDVSTSNISSLLTRKFWSLLTQLISVLFWLSII